MSECCCKICTLLRRIAPLRARAKPDERAALGELLLRWEAAATSAVFWEMKFKGTWPSMRVERRRNVELATGEGEKHEQLTVPLEHD